MWAGGVLAVAAAVAAAVVLLPSAAKQPRVSASPNTAPVQVDPTPRSVPMTAARERAVTALLDTFVLTAVARHKPLRALPLVTASFRGGVTRNEWARGNLPAMPYHATGKHFPWTLGYSYPHEISATVLLHPAPREQLGAVAFTAVFKQRGKRWLIDSFIPVASFAPEHQAPNIIAQNDFLPAMATQGSAHLDKKWLLIPGAFLLLIVLVPLAVVLVNWRRSRRAWREYDRPLSPS
jgi:hypothetical protein